MSGGPLVVKSMDDVAVTRQGAAVRWARKLPVVIRVCEMHFPFLVETREGTVAGVAGDYLMEGVRGELYPCAKDIFEETYEFVKEP